MASTDSVSVKCLECGRILKDIISKVLDADQNKTRIRPVQVSDELDRFSLWAGNIGALHKEESPLSLESRLRKEEDGVLQHIKQLLDDLAEVSRELLEIVSGEREGDANFRAGQADDGSEVVKDEESELIGEIGDNIRRLFRISTLIRQAPSTDLFTKALSRDRYRFNEQFDIGHVGEKFPKLAADDLSWLRIRLGRAITQRRHYLSYIRDHRDKLEATEPGLAAPTSAEPSSQEVFSSNFVPAHDSSSRPSTFFTKASSIQPGLISTANLAKEELSDHEDDAKSYTTISRSIDGDVDNMIADRITLLDELPQGANGEVECPFCFRMRKFKNEKRWKKHVFSDLRSYVCTSRDCEGPYFNDIDDWFRHEMENHMVYYKCFVCPAKVYHLKEKYLSHVRRSHPELLSTGDERPVLDIARQPLKEISAGDCPCCTEWQNKVRLQTVSSTENPSEIICVVPTVFKRHVASHLETLSLFAIPTGSADHVDAGSNNAIETSIREENLDSLILDSLASLPSIPSHPSSDSLHSPENNLWPPTEMKEMEGNEEKEYRCPNCHDTLPTSVDRAQHTRECRSQPQTMDSDTTSDSESGENLESNEEVAKKRQELKSCKRNFGKYDPRTLACMSFLISNYLSQGRFSEAEKLQVRLVKYDETKYGENHATTLNSMSELALTYFNQGQFSDAEKLQVPVMESYKQKVGEHHPDALWPMGNLASTYRSQGRLYDAMRLQEQVVKGYEKFFGANHDTTLNSMSELARTYSIQGRFSDAEKLQVQVMETYKQKVGKDHVDTMRSVYNVISTCRMQGRLSEAERLQVPLLSVQNKTLGEDHPDTLTSMNMLASICTEQGRYEEAVVLWRQILEKCERILGEDHPDTLSVMDSLASACAEQGRYEEANDLWEQTLDKRKRILSEDHPNTLSVMDSLASSCAEQGRYDKANDLWEQTLDKRKRILGEDHPNTLSVMDSLASSYAEQGRYDEANDLWEQTLDKRKRRYGERHPKTLTSMSDLALVFWAKGQKVEAYHLLRSCAQLQEQVMGPGHRDALASRSRLEEWVSDKPSLKDS